MKKAVILATLSILTLLIVLSIKSFVNQTSGNPVLNNPALRVDGNPYPPLPKKRSISPATLVADGNPYPPLPKKRSISPATLVADGNPYPPLPKKRSVSSDSLIADGNPYPPLSA